MMLIDEIVQRNLHDNKKYIFGYADLHNLLEERYSEYKFGIVIGRRLDDEIIDSIEKGPNRRYYEHYNMVNDELSQIGNGIRRNLNSNNIKSLSVAPTLTDADRNERFNRSLKLDFSHKLVATRAGLGWIGKSDLLITYRFGPRVRLVSILVDIPVDYCQKPVLRSECGGCDRCVQSCPAHALSGKDWDISIKREEIFDAFQCREKCRELGELNIGEGIRLCGICVSVCPVGAVKGASQKP